MTWNYKESDCWWKSAAAGVGADDNDEKERNDKDSSCWWNPYTGVGVGVGIGIGIGVGGKERHHDKEDHDVAGPGSCAGKCRALRDMDDGGVGSADVMFPCSWMEDEREEEEYDVDNDDDDVVHHEKEPSEVDALKGTVLHQRLYLSPPASSSYSSSSGTNPHESAATPAFILEKYTTDSPTFSQSFHPYSQLTFPAHPSSCSPSPSSGDNNHHHNHPHHPHHQTTPTTTTTLCTHTAGDSHDPSLTHIIPRENSMVLWRGAFGGGYCITSGTRGLHTRRRQHILGPREDDNHEDVWILTESQLRARIDRAVRENKGWGDELDDDGRCVTSPVSGWSDDDDDDDGDEEGDEDA